MEAINAILFLVYMLCPAAFFLRYDHLKFRNIEMDLGEKCLFVVGAFVSFLFGFFFSNITGFSEYTVGYIIYTVVWLALGGYEWVKKTLEESGREITEEISRRSG